MPFSTSSQPKKMPKQRKQTEKKTNGAPEPRAWQRMLSGRRLDILNPSPLDIEIEDIAHGLARVTRWNGQTRGKYGFSVAQHCVLVERLVRLNAPKTDQKWCLAALLHDAPEYVIGDIISPFKAVIGDAYKSVEHRILAAIHLRFSLPAKPAAALTKLTKQADRAAAFLEAVAVAGFSETEAAQLFGDQNIPLRQIEPLMRSMSSQEAELLFLARFAEIDAQMDLPSL